MKRILLALAVLVLVAATAFPGEVEFRRITIADYRDKVYGAWLGLSGATCLLGDTVVTYPRDSRPCLLERAVTLGAGRPKAALIVGSVPGHRWRLKAFVNDDAVAEKVIGSPGADAEKSKPGSPAPTESGPAWTEVNVDLSNYASQSIILRLYQRPSASQLPESAYWRKAVIE